MLIYLTHMEYGILLSSLTDFENSVMSVKGKKVLHIDRNDHYGGCVSFQVCLCFSQLTIYSEAASVNIESVCLLNDRRCVR